MAQFPANDIISLVGPAPRYELAESVGPDLRLAELIDPDELADLPLAYGSAAGSARLRAAIADGHGVGPDDVVVTVGGMHALFLLAFTLCNRGDAAVLAEPCFPLARNALHAVGAEIAVLRLSFDSGYRLDPAELRPLLSPRTRLVALASPQNPSGVALPMATLRAVTELIAELCPEAYFLLDETYREAAYGNDPVADSAVGLGDRVVSVGSLSKCHGAPGLRVGWVVTRDPELRRQLIVAKFNTVVSCSAIDEALALKVFERRAPIIAARRRRLLGGLRRTADWVRDNGDLVDWVRPDGGAICCVRLKPGRFDEAVARFHEAAAAKGVRVANGAWFGDETRVFRLGFGLLPLPELDAALSALAAALHEIADPPGRPS